MVGLGDLKDYNHILFPIYSGLENFWVDTKLWQLSIKDSLFLFEECLKHCEVVSVYQTDDTL